MMNTDNLHVDRWETIFVNSKYENYSVTLQIAINDTDKDERIFAFVHFICKFKCF